MINPYGNESYIESLSNPSEKPAMKTRIRPFGSWLIVVWLLGLNFLFVLVEAFYQLSAE